MIKLILAVIYMNELVAGIEFSKFTRILFVEATLPSDLQPHVVTLRNNANNQYIPMKCAIQCSVNEDCLYFSYLEDKCIVWGCDIALNTYTGVLDSSHFVYRIRSSGNYLSMMSYGFSVIQ